ncbi:MAG: hypothetical protein ACRDYY_14965 [Acidimicrobiales bacterium]
MAASSDFVASAAAHGITPRVIASWLPTLPRWSRVLVPIEVDALVLRPGAQELWADCQMTTPPGGTTSGSPADARTLLPPPFKELDPKLRTPGVYLHWALPDALTAGSQNYDPSQPDAARNTQFPAIPDRWLIVRIGPDEKGGRRAVNGWVIQAESETPVVTGLDQYLGAPHDSSTHGPLTALGHGDPAWAAYYDNVVNRLAFHDPLSTDTPAGTLAYLVCGWYSDPTQDLLAASETPTLAAFESRVKSLGWQLDTSALDAAAKSSHDNMSAAASYGLSTPLLGTALDALNPKMLLDKHTAVVDAASSLAGVAEYTSVDAWWPQQILCHGAAVGIGWPTDSWSGNTSQSLSTSAGGPPDPASINVALGATSGETLGTIVAHASGSPDDIRLVEAFSVHVLDEVDQPDGRANLDDALHQGAFGSLPGGETTEVIRDPPVPPAPPLPTTPGTPGPGIFADRATAKFPAPDLTFINARSERFSESNVSTPTYSSALRGSEVSVIDGRLPNLGGVLGGTPASTPHPARDITVRRSLPRLWHHTDPVILLQGGRRSFKHGADGRMNADGQLVCRLTGDTVTALVLNVPQQPDQSASITGADLLARGIENGAVPPECDALLSETVLLDPGSSLAAAVAAATGRSAVPVNTWRDHVLVEQTVWWALRDRAVDPAPIVSRCGYSGHLPSPIAITPPQRPWVPLHLDWEVSVTPDSLNDWTLDEIDFIPAPTNGSPPAAAPPLLLKGRSLLTAGIAKAAADAARKALDDASKSAGAGTIPAGMRERYGSAVQRLVVESLATATANITIREGAAAATGSGGGGAAGPLSAADAARLGSIASMLDNMDVLATSLDGITDQLRKGAPAIVGPATPAPAKPPEGMLALRSGRIQITRLRLVDCFGQTLDLAGSSDGANADPTKILLGDVIVDPATPGVGMLPPRFTAPGRLWFRWADATSGSTDGTINPLCGFVVPNHLDGDVELFDPAGAALGTVLPDDTSGIAFEDPPGKPPTVGQSLTAAIRDEHLRGLVQGLIDWGRADRSENREGALSALMRSIDSTRWSVDPFGQTGEEHLSLLIGHPVAVMRASLKVEVQDPAAPPENAWTAVPVRLGALTHWKDGLYGFFVNDDYGTLHVAEEAALMARDVGPLRGFLGPIAQVPAAAAALTEGLTTPYQNPVSHPYVDPGFLIWIRPGQQISLTLLVEPQTSVHATTGLLPRKDIGVRREWVAPGLAAIAPTFRFGPVLVDPKQVALPLAKDLAGTWTWDHRSDVVQWADDSVVDAGKPSGLSSTPAIASEGWLRLTPPAPSGGSQS